jgi:carboxylesterase type B
MNLIDTKYGTISGVIENGYTVFRGIPYAKPPIGDLRFHVTEEIDPWDGVYQDDTFGAFHSGDFGICSGLKEELASQLNSRL